jgi:Ni/Fe-hydrogenase 1 B-type cytochrome subunit
MAVSTHLPARFERVYVWERPIRLYHWVNVLCLLVLIATGFLIGRPPVLLSAGDASSGYWFGWVRLLHFVAAWVFLYIFIVRVYWAFVGNTYARWQNFLPITPARLRHQARGVLTVLKTDILQVQKRPVDFLGHNPLAAWSYLATFVATIFQIVTGFGLYAAMSTSSIAHAFAWIVPLMGGDMAVRQWHHLATWFFVVFSLVHIYLAVFHDFVEGHGEISSIVSGSRFEPRP